MDSAKMGNLCEMDAVLTFSYILISEIFYLRFRM